MSVITGGYMKITGTERWFIRLIGGSSHSGLIDPSYQVPWSQMIGCLLYPTSAQVRLFFGGYTMDIHQVPAKHMAK